MSGVYRGRGVCCQGSRGRRRWLVSSPRGGKILLFGDDDERRFLPLCRGALGPSLFPNGGIGNRAGSLSRGMSDGPLPMWLLVTLASCPQNFLLRNYSYPASVCPVHSKSPTARGRARRCPAERTIAQGSVTQSMDDQQRVVLARLAKPRHTHVWLGEHARLAKPMAQTLQVSRSQVMRPPPMIYDIGQ